MSISDDEYLKAPQINLDLGREDRCGVPEVVLAEGKDSGQVQEAVLGILAASGRALVTRLEGNIAAELAAALPQGSRWAYDRQARFGLASASAYKPSPPLGRLGLLTAGTSDYPVAREAQLTATALACETRLASDCGAAGLHRLKAPLEEMLEWGAQVFIVAAGREGTLPTLVAGLVDRPVIGLPVSTGYGIGGRGEAALYSMLQSCAPLLVVNIDAGFVAGATAARIIAITAEGPSHG